MTELEHKAAEVWALYGRQPSIMEDSAGLEPLPAGIALDMVQDVTGERREAYAAIYKVAVDPLLDDLQWSDTLPQMICLPHFTCEEVLKTIDGLFSWNSDTVNHIREQSLMHARRVFVLLNELARCV